MLEITVKTMDSQSRKFSLPENAAVRDLKAKILNELNIPVARQRLIFQGRVLSDELKLTKDHHQKVFHLVQRLPVSTSASVSTANTSTPASQTGQAPNSMFNSNHLSQIFQQALGGLGNVMGTGGPVITGSLSANADAPGAHTMNFHIEVTRPPNTTQNTTATNVRSVPHHHHHHHHSISAPRQQLNTANRVLNDVERTLDEVESIQVSSSSADSRSYSEAVPSTDYENASAEQNVSAGEIDADENMDVPEDATLSTAASTSAPSLVADDSSTNASTQTSSPLPQQSAAAGGGGSGAQPRPGLIRHPSLPELGSTYSRLLTLQRRFEPLMEFLITFLNTDPPFTSTESPEYRVTSRKLSLILKVQQMLSVVHRILSRAVIPLGRTPPRVMLVRAPVGVQSPPGGTREGNLAHGGVPPPRQNVTTARPHVQISSTPWLNMPQQPGQAPAGRGTQIRVVRMTAPITSTGIPPPSASHPVGQMPMPNFWPQPQRRAARQQESNNPAPTASANSQQRVTVAPPQYNVEINANIRPHISISVQPPSGTSVASTVQPNRNSQTAESAASSDPFAGLPNVPGVPADSFRNVINTVMNQLEEELGGGRPEQNRRQNTGRSSQNDVSQDISNMMGQAVSNAMFSHLTGPSSEVSCTLSTSYTSTTATMTSSAEDIPTTSNSRTNVPIVSSQESIFSDRGNDNSGKNESPFDAGKPGTSGVKDIITGGSFGSKGATDQRKEPKSQSLPLAPGRETGKKEVMDIINSENKARGSLHTPEPVSFDPSVLGVDPAQRALSQLAINANIPNILEPDATILRYARQLGFLFPDTHQTVGNMAERIGFVCAEVLTMKEAIGFYFGNPEPLIKVRSALQKFCLEEFFNGKTPTRDDIAMVAEVLSEAFRPNVAEFFKSAKSKVITDVDIVESNLSLHRCFVRKSLEILFFAENASYPARMNKHFRLMVAIMVRMNEHLMKGGRKMFDQLIRASPFFVNDKSPLPELCRVLQGIDTKDDDPLISVLNTMRNFSHVSQDQIDQFVISPSSGAVGNMKSEEPKMETKSARSLPTDSQRSSSSGSNVDKTPAASNREWKKEIPAEWVETISGDVEKQRSMAPQPPFSEAYMAGMPASKRRKIVS